MDFCVDCIHCKFVKKSFWDLYGFSGYFCYSPHLVDIVTGIVEPDGCNYVRRSKCKSTWFKRK